MYQFNHSHLFRKTLLDNNKMVSRTGGARVGRGGAPAPPWLLIEFFRNSRLDFKVVTIWHGGKKKIEKKRLLLGWKWPNHCFCFVLLQLAPISLFFIFYFISLFTPFLLFMILFRAFYSWMMLEILQILLLISYKFACHQLQKIISNLFIIFFK